MNQQKSFSHFGRGCRSISADAQELTPRKIRQIVFYDISLNLQIFPETNEFCNKSQTPNKIPLIILSQKHAHCEHFSSLPFLLFNSMQRSPLFQEDLDFPLLFHFAPGADYEGAVPLMTRWHINLYYQEQLRAIMVLDITMCKRYQGST